MLTAFLILWAVLFILAVLARGMVPTTVQPTHRDTAGAVIGSAVVAGIVVLLGGGVVHAVGGLV